MLLRYYNLVEDPFGVTPDPRFLYLGPKHREALASLIYGTESRRGFLALIAKPGMGKTSLLYQYMEGLRGRARTAFVFRTDCNSQDFIHQVLVDAGVENPGRDLPTMYETLDRMLTEEMRAGRRFVLVIDEAQNLDDRVLESIRMLSNFETPWMKLMQIVIAGQPQLAETLLKPTLTQFRQRISSVIRLEPFTQAEVDSYIDHRLWAAGCNTPNLFTAPARRLIAEHSEGIPRQINNICFNAMSLACALKQTLIDRDVVLEVLRDLDIEGVAEERLREISTERKQHGPPQVQVPSGKPWRRKIAAVAAVFSFMVCATALDSGGTNHPLRAETKSNASQFVAPASASVTAAQRGAVGLVPTANHEAQTPGSPSQRQNNDE